MEQYKQKILQYIERAFGTVLDTQAARDAKEELYANLVDKFEELVLQGHSYEDAYYGAIDSIGDIYEMLDNLNEDFDAPRTNKTNKKTGVERFLSAVAAVPYCIGFAVVLLICILFYKPTLATEWKCLICLGSVLFLLGCMWVARCRKNMRILLPAVILTAILFVLTLGTIILPLNSRFEGMMWLVVLMALAGYEAITSLMPFLKDRKGKKDE